MTPEECDGCEQTYEICTYSQASGICPCINCLLKMCCSTACKDWKSFARKHMKSERGKFVVT